jgi:KDO2-lipid IV(A) lauroyltransferase
MQRLIYIFVYPILWLLSILPFPVLYAISDFLYYVVFYIIRYRKKVVLENLALVFPEKTKKERLTIAKRFYSHFCDMAVESIKSLTISEKELKKRFVFTNIEEIQRLENNHKSIMLLAAHYASWEWVFILQRYLKNDGYAVYKRLGNKYFDNLVKRVRAKYNTHLITTKETVFKIKKTQHLGIPAVYGFLSDQSPKVKKAVYWRNFMGIKVPVYVSAENLAKELDMAVIFLKVKKVKRGHYQATVITITETPKEMPNYKITDTYLDLVEAEIREAPEYYFWTHKRWKHKDKVPPEFL